MSPLFVYMMAFLLYLMLAGGVLGLSLVLGIFPRTRQLALEDPYGRRTKVSGVLDCDFGFTGHYWHATSSLYLAPYRAYDPNLGRWISRDPSGEGSGLNLYAYCGGSPVNEVDPSGLDPITDLNELTSEAEQSFQDLSDLSCMDFAPGNLSGPPLDVEAASEVADAAGLTAAAAEKFGPKIGSNGTLYFSEFARGNQYYKIIANISKVGKLAGPAGLFAGTLVDAVGVSTHQVSRPQAMLNFTMGVVGLFPPYGSAASAAYTGFEMLPDAPTGDTPNLGQMVLESY